MVVDSLGDGDGGGEVVRADHLEVLGLLQSGRHSDLHPLAGPGLPLSNQAGHAVTEIVKNYNDCTHVHTSHSELPVRIIEVELNNLIIQRERITSAGLAAER